MRGNLMRLRKERIAVLIAAITAVGAVGSVSPLTWEKIMFNEGSPQTMAADGQVELLAAASQGRSSGDF